MQGLVHKHVFLFCLLLWPRSHDILITIRSPRTQKNLKLLLVPESKEFYKKKEKGKETTESHPREP